MGPSGMFKQALSLCFIVSAIVSVSECHVLPHPPVTRDVPTASIRQGQVIGARDASGNSEFLGIPFAATTGGKNRYATKYSDLFLSPKFTARLTLLDGCRLKQLPNSSVLSRPPSMAQHVLKPSQTLYSLSSRRIALTWIFGHQRRERNCPFVLQF